MDRHILKRDEFVNEAFGGHDKGYELNEGVVDFFKIVFKKEWKNIKSKNAEIKNRLEEADRSLTGYTMLKAKNGDICNKIRQALTDFANTLWESKLKDIEDGKKLQKMLMGLKDNGKITGSQIDQIDNTSEMSSYIHKFDIKNKALADSLDVYDKKIRKFCNENPDLINWAELLKDDTRLIINKMIIDKYEEISGEDDRKKIDDERKKLEEQENEERKRTERKNRAALEKQKNQLKEIEDERENIFSGMGVKPLRSQAGDKAFKTLKDAFSSIFSGVKSVKEEHEYSFDAVINESRGSVKLSDKMKEVLNGDIYFGLDTLVKGKKVGNRTVKTIVREIDTVFDVLDGVIKKDKRIKSEIAAMPSDCVHALFLGLSKAITFAVTGEKLSAHKDVLDLLARCSIDSDKTLGYGFPVLDAEHPENGNVFTAIMQTLIDANDKKGVFKDPKVLADFKKNMKNMSEEIYKRAKDLKEQRENEDE